MSLAPVTALPQIDITGKFNGHAYSSRLAVIESMVINGAVYHDPSKFEGGWTTNGNVSYLTGIYRDGPLATVEAIVIQKSDAVIDIALTVRNDSTIAWPDDSRIVQCFPQKDNPSLCDAMAARTLASQNDVDTHINLLGAIWQWPQWSMQTATNNPQQRTSDKWVYRSSDDGAQFIGIFSSDTPMLSGNCHPDYRCIHSNPSIGPLAPGAYKTVRQRICLNETSAANVKNALRFA